MIFKRFFYIVFLAIVVSLLGILMGIVAVDPFQQYRRGELFIHDQRLGNPGIAKYYEYNAVITGSSMAMNHYPSQVDSLFGWKSINLTVAGVLDYDYSVLLPYVVSLGKMEHLIMTIDYFSFIRPIEPLELYLYDTYLWNDYEYWFNYTSIKYAVNKLKNKVSIPRDNLYHFNQPLGRDYVLNDFQQDNNSAYFANYNFSCMEQRFDKMLSIIMPVLSDVNIYVYIPPYSILKFRLYEENEHWTQILEFKQYMIEKLLEYPNVKLYDFQKEEFICNLDEYMDVFHHSHKYNKRIIECLYKDSCRVREDNYMKELAVLDSLVRHYRLND